MKRLRICALLLVLVLLTACGRGITAEEARLLALEAIRSEAGGQYTQLYEERITCQREERDGTMYYRVEVPFACEHELDYERKFLLMIDVDTGEIDTFGMTK